MRFIFAAILVLLSFMFMLALPASAGMPAPFELERGPLKAEFPGAPPEAKAWFYSFPDMDNPDYRHRMVCVGVNPDQLTCHTFTSKALYCEVKHDLKQVLCSIENPDKVRHDETLGDQEDPFETKM